MNFDGCTGGGDLDKLVQGYEFENQQNVRFIEQENQLIQALEKDSVEKTAKTERLKEDIASIDANLKHIHKQFTQNRDNCDSLEQTSVVLMEHEHALSKKLDALKVIGVQDRAEREGILQHYRSIWAEYEAKYKSFPKAKVLQEKLDGLAMLEEEVRAETDKVNQLKHQLNLINGPTEFDIRDMQTFVTKLAELKVDTGRKNRQIERINTEKRNLEAKVQAMKEEEAAQVSASVDDSDAMSMDSVIETSQIVIEERPNESDTSTEEDSSAMISMLSGRGDDQPWSRSDATLPGYTETTASQWNPLAQPETQLPPTEPAATSVLNDVPHQANMSSLQPPLPAFSLKTQAPVIFHPQQQQKARSDGNNQQTVSRPPLVPPVTFSSNIQRNIQDFQVPRQQLAPPVTNHNGIIQQQNSSGSAPTKCQSGTYKQPMISMPTTEFRQPSLYIPMATLRQPANSVQLPSVHVPASPVEQMPSQAPARAPMYPQINYPATRKPMGSPGPPSQSHVVTIQQSSTKPRKEDTVVMMPTDKNSPTNFFRPSHPSHVSAPQLLDPSSLITRPQFSGTSQANSAVVPTAITTVSEVSCPVTIPMPNMHQEGIAQKVVHIDNPSVFPPKSPGLSTKSAESPKTPNSQQYGTSPINQYSPFDLDKHIQKMKMLTTSPGVPSFEPRFMYNEQQIMQQDKQPSPDAIVGESPYIQNFFSCPTNEESVFNPGEKGSFQVENIQNKSVESTGSFFSMNSTMEPEASGGGFSFGGSETSGQSFMSIFSGGDSTPDPGKQTKETSFSFNFGGDTSLF